jgi:2-polyprenyl-3-methyl-5-hydroxy-6-metoxy-1,4-benzoquinol methylase
VRRMARRHQAGDGCPANERNGEVPRLEPNSASSDRLWPVVGSTAKRGSSVQFSDWEDLQGCILCGGASLHSIPSLRHLKRCWACGHVQLSPRPTQSAIAASYDIQDEGTHATWDAQRDGRRQLWAKRAERATGYFAQPGCALDIGAGFGDFGAELQSRGWEVKGTEVSADAVTRARDRGVVLQLGQPEDIAWPAQSFDLVTMWHVLEHLPFPGRTLDECTRLIRPGGMLIVAVPNDSLFPRLAGYIATGRLQAVTALWGIRGPGEEIHLSFFSPRRLRKALTRANLSPLEIDLDDHYPAPSPDSARELRRNRAILHMTQGRVSIHRTIYAASRCCMSRAL